MISFKVRGGGDDMSWLLFTPKGQMEQSSLKIRMKEKKNILLVLLPPLCSSICAVMEKLQDQVFRQNTDPTGQIQHKRKGVK